MNYNQPYYPLAEAGDIIFCNFPDRDDLDTEYHGDPFFEPPHYCLVLASDQDTDSVLVMYGTSKISKYINKKGILLNGNLVAKSNLKTDTKFIFDQESIALIPYNRQYVNKKNHKSIIGQLPEEKHEELKKLLKNSGFISYKNKLASSCETIISKHTKKYF